MEIENIDIIYKLDSYLNDYYLDIEDNVYLFFKWILENKDLLTGVKGVRQLTMYRYYNYIEHMGLQDTKETRDEFIQIWESIHNQ